MKLLVNISSFYWIIFFYYLHNELFILNSCEQDRYMSTILYLLFGFILSYSSLKYMIYTSYKQSSDNLNIEKIHPVYTEYMPIYLAIAVIAFELNNVVDISNSFTVIILFFSIFILFSISNIGYLNPVWFFLGYRIYKIENTKANYIFISHKNKDNKSITKLDGLKKVDEFVFIKRKG